MQSSKGDSSGKGVLGGAHGDDSVSTLVMKLRTPNSDKLSIVKELCNYAIKYETAVPEMVDAAIIQTLIELLRYHPERDELYYSVGNLLTIIVTSIDSIPENLVNVSFVTMLLQTLAEETKEKRSVAYDLLMNIIDTSQSNGECVVLSGFISSFYKVLEKNPRGMDSLKQYLTILEKLINKHISVESDPSAKGLAEALEKMSQVNNKLDQQEKKIINLFKQCVKNERK